jgi:hypothetical protein
VPCGFSLFVPTHAKHFVACKRLSTSGHVCCPQLGTYHARLSGQQVGSRRSKMPQSRTTSSSPPWAVQDTTAAINMEPLRALSRAARGRRAALAKPVGVNTSRGDSRPRCGSQLTSPARHCRRRRHRRWQPVRALRPSAARAAARRRRTGLQARRRAWRRRAVQLRRRRQVAVERLVVRGLGARQARLHQPRLGALLVQLALRAARGNGQATPLSMEGRLRLQALLPKSLFMYLHIG